MSSRILQSIIKKNTCKLLSVRTAEMTRNTCCSQRAQVRFLAPTWWFTTVHNSSSRESDALLTSMGTKHECGIHTHVGKTLIHKMNKSNALKNQSGGNMRWKLCYWVQTANSSEEVTNVTVWCPGGTSFCSWRRWHQKILYWGLGIQLTGLQWEKQLFQLHMFPDARPALPTASGDSLPLEVYVHHSLSFL